MDIFFTIQFPEVRTLNLMIMYFRFAVEMFFALNFHNFDDCMINKPLNCLFVNMFVFDLSFRPCP